MKKKSLTYLFLILFNVCFTQNKEAVFLEGELYVKYKESAKKKIVKNKRKLAINDFGFGEKKFSSYKIKEVENSFYFLKRESSLLENIVRIKFEDTSKTDELIEELESLSEVEYVERIPINYKTEIPNDQLFDSQWHLDVINAQEAWDIEKGSSSITIGVVDGAFDVNHEDLKDNVEGGWDVANDDDDVSPDYPDHTHGTNVAGVAAASTNNGIGIASIGRNINFIPIKSTNSENKLAITHGYPGLVKAAEEGAKIINLSWGSSNYSDRFEDIVNDVYNSCDCIIIASAGNSNTNEKNYPAAYDNVIAVASSDLNDLKSSFSNYGDWVSVTAPGTDIFTTDDNSEYRSVKGTSFSSPMVASLMGLVWSANPTFSREEVVASVLNSAVPLSWSGGGTGRIDALAALNYATNIEDITIGNTTLSSANVSVDEEFTVSTNQVYEGSQLATNLPDFNLGYYLSSDCSLSSDDLLLGEDTSSLGSDNTTESESKVLEIPSNITSGNYYIIFSGDDSNVLEEYNEENNTTCIQITVSNTTPALNDITLSNIILSLTDIIVGTEFTVSVDQNYSGAQPSSTLPDFELAYYLSNDCTLSLDDTLLGQRNSNLGSDNTSDNKSETLLLTYPSSIVSGTYYLIFSADNNNVLVETKEDNNVSCIQITINNDDITVTDVILSSTDLNLGETFAVAANHNYSGVDIEDDLPFFDLDYYLSRDCELSSDDTLLGEDISSLGSDGNNISEKETAYLTIPTNITVGDYYILFSGDNDKELEESNEENNVVCVPITVDDKVLESEDITVTNPTVSSTNVNIGETVAVTINQNYSGYREKSATPYIHLEYYLSKDLSLDGDDVPLDDEVSNIGIDNTTEIEKATLRIPSDVVSGYYYILFSGDHDNDIEESNENNNIAYVRIIVSNEDITITNTVVSSTSLNLGESFSVEAYQNYLGAQLEATLPFFDLDYYLSEDCTLSSDDILLGEDASSIGIDDVTDIESAVLTIPSNIALGNYYIIFSGDNDNELEEPNEDNNTVCVQVTVGNSTSTTEDITVSDATISSADVLVGERVTFTVDHNYLGYRLDSSLPAVYLGYYLSEDCNLSSDDVLLGKDLSSLGSDDVTHQENARLIIPLNTVSGDYYVIFSGDDTNEIQESDETNNTVCVQITVSNYTISPIEDITISSTTISSTNLEVGEEFTVTANQNYSGVLYTWNLPYIDLDYYLSEDCNLSADDFLLGGDISNLGRNDPREAESTVLTVPLHIASGNYYVIFSADNDNELEEIDEENNTVCFQITVNNYSTLPLEDITVSDITLSSTDLEVGEEFTVTANQNYLGAQLDSDLPSFDLDYYLSEDCDLSTDDVLLGGDVSGLGSDDVTNTEREVLTIPSNMISGNYYIILSGDNDDELEESNEINNTACVQITINATISSAEAIVSSIDKSNGEDFDLKDQIKVFPNPSSDIINVVSNDDFEIKKLAIYDVNGRFVRNVNDKKIDISSLESGMYFLSVESENIKTMIKIVKE